MDDLSCLPGIWDVSINLNNTTKENTTHNIKVITGTFFYTSKQITVDKAKHECLAMQYIQPSCSQRTIIILDHIPYR